MNKARKYLDLVSAMDLLGGMYEHDEIYHEGRFDPNSMSCSLREKLKAGDESDIVKPDHVKFGERMQRLYEYYSENGVTKKLVQDLQTAVEDLKAGRAVPERLPGDTFKGGVVGIPDWFIGAYCLAVRDRGANKMSLSNNKLLEDLARASGAYIEDTGDYCRDSYGDYFAQGGEADVYQEDDSNVIKASTMSYSNSLVAAMERLILGNLVFPESAQELVAVGADKKRPSADIFMLRQRCFQYEEVSDYDIMEWFADKDFVPDERKLESYVSEDGQLACGDCHTGNIVENLDDEDGDFVNIDPCLEIRYDVKNPPRTLVLAKRS